MFIRLLAVLGLTLLVCACKEQPPASRSTAVATPTQLQDVPAAAPAGAPAAPAAAGPLSDEQKIVYALGLLVAQNLQPYSLTPEELGLVTRGMQDAYASNPQVDLAEYRAQLGQLAQDRARAAADAEKAAAQGFLDAASQESGAQRTDSGLIFIELVPGTGESPKATDTVKVQYHGTLRDGTVFDSSRDRGTPATFPLNRVIPCWTEGVQKMKVGGKAKLICPANIAYGDRGAPPKIKPGAPLVFEVELLEIQPAPPSGELPTKP
ncbi:MAG: FKBP-type peptidyl-prolyl cis-trans isomerase [Candidatus Binatia bacterium]